MRRPSFGIEHGVGQALVEELVPHFLFGLHVVRVRFVFDAEQRRLGDVDVAALHELEHLAVEEREEQRADVRAIDVGIGHDDDAAVAALGEVLIFADADADGGDHAADFFVGENFVFARFVGVDDFAAQGEDRLILAHPATLGRAAGRITFDEVQFALVDVAAGAIAELAGQAAAGEGAFAIADQFFLLAGGDAGLGREQAFVDDRLRDLGILFEELAEVLADSRLLTMPSTSPLPSLVLVWPSNCGWGTRQLMTAVRPSRKSSPVGTRSLKRPLSLPYLLMRAGERGAEAGKVRAAFGRVDVVDVRVDVFGVLLRVLQGDFDGDAFALAFDVQDVGVDRLRSRG